MRSLKVNRFRIGLIVLAGLVTALAVWVKWMAVRAPEPRTSGGSTVADQVDRYGPAARGRLKPFFRKAKVPFPPDRFAIAAFKQEGELDLFAAGPEQRLTFIRRYPVLAASGKLGPKREDGDRQVPEGIYRIEALNPNSQFHLSLRLNYPNAADRLHANQEGRTDLGGDIMIHGKTSSVGCLAMGDVVAEELFVLAADSGWDETRVIVSPVDFRRHELPREYKPQARWVKELYEELKQEIEALPSS